jgi:hypothetical protein
MFTFIRLWKAGYKLPSPSTDELFMMRNAFRLSGGRPEDWREWMRGQSGAYKRSIVRCAFMRRGALRPVPREYRGISTLKMVAPMWHRKRMAPTHVRVRVRSAFRAVLATSNGKSVANEGFGGVWAHIMSYVGDTPFEGAEVHVPHMLAWAARGEWKRLRWGLQHEKYGMPHFVGCIALAMVPELLLELGCAFLRNGHALAFERYMLFAPKEMFTSSGARVALLVSAARKCSWEEVQRLRDRFEADETTDRLMRNAALENNNLPVVTALRGEPNGQSVMRAALRGYAAAVFAIRGHVRGHLGAKRLLASARGDAFRVMPRLLTWLSPVDHLEARIEREAAGFGNVTNMTHIFRLASGGTPLTPGAVVHLMARGRQDIVFTIDYDYGTLEDSDVMRQAIASGNHEAVIDALEYYPVTLGAVDVLFETRNRYIMWSLIADRPIEMSKLMTGAMYDRALLREGGAPWELHEVLMTAAFLQNCKYQLTPMFLDTLQTCIVASCGPTTPASDVALMLSIYAIIIPPHLSILGLRSVTPCKPGKFDEWWVERRSNPLTKIYVDTHVSLYLPNSPPSDTAETDSDQSTFSIQTGT